MRTLGIDFGQRRIGLAISDESGRLASPFQVLEIRTPESAITDIVKISRDESIERLVVGLPLNMDDTVGPAAKNVIEWGKRLAGESRLPVVFVDERLSSFAADQLLRQTDLTRKGKKKRQDALAAADFLQGFLDGRLTAYLP
jgi:putative Holliday junction resolvase